MNLWCTASQRVLCGKCWESFCGVSCDVNANLEHHNTIYVIHFKNAFVFKYLQLLCQLLVSKILTHIMGYDAT